MLTSLKLENVRLFQGAEWQFKLAPLTILCGTNSAGKSTVFRTIGLLSQSLTMDGSKIGELRFVGNRVDLGNHATFISNGDTSQNLSIGVELDYEIASSTVEFLRTLPHQSPKNNNTTNTKTEPTDASLPSASDIGPTKCKIAYNFSFGPSSKGDSRFVLKRLDCNVAVNDQSLLSWHVVEDHLLEEKYTTRYHLIMPRRYFERVGGPKLFEAEQLDADNVKLPAVLLDIIPQFVAGKPPKKKQRRHRKGNVALQEPERDRWNLMPLPPTIAAINSHFRHAIHNAQYVGPLRAAAKRYYLADTDNAQGMDTTGAFSPHVLKDQKDNEIFCSVPGGATQESTLLRLLSIWLRYMRTGKFNETADSSDLDDIKVDATKGVLVELAIRGPQGTYPLIDSGFGYSQLLPILLKGLLAEPDSILLIEQPELHLHPAVQVRLAEFLVAMMRDGQQVIIETHSEHLVNAVRVLAAEDDTGEIAAKSAIFFIDGDRSPPRLHDLSIQPDGTIPNWPSNFFGEAASLTGRLLKAQRKVRERGKR
ncbi:AAA family ATPase [Polyangium jinanense]|uniref:AAA family ATPase n=1 Tax=Polyangium jinanense TaxID=2829994 RepID=UPI00233FE04A|nr:AAA family ATPase [Polyangium jinanense]MDC3962565.1 AAA family ATPase [Polyangium jinanense]